MKPGYVLLLAATLVTSRGLASPQGQRDAQSGSQGPARGPEIGSQAPDFKLNVLNGQGKTMQISSLKGKAVLVNFWATWCEPCKIEMPWLVELQKKYGPQGLQIVGVAVDDAEEKTISEFARKMKVNYPVLIGTEKVADTYGGVAGLPTSFFLDRGGKVVNRVTGLVSESEIEDSVKKSMAQGDSSTASAK